MVTGSGGGIVIAATVDEIVDSSLTSRAMTDTVAPLSPSRYAALLRDIKKLIDDAEAASNAQKVQVYWRVGQRITAERITQRAGYHNTVLRELSDDSSIAVRTLQRAVRFNATYKKPPKDSLNWSQYRVLLECTDDAERKRLRQLAIEQGISSRDLAVMVRAHKERGDGSNTATSKHALKRPTDASYLYGVTVHNVVDGDTLDLDIDLGFRIKRGDRFRLADLDAPEAKAKGGREAKRFVLSRLLPATTIVVKTLRVDLHGRYIAHLFYSPEKLSLHDCFIQGTHLNNELIEAGHAVKVV